MCRASFGRTNELPGRPSEDTDNRKSVGSACGFSCCPVLRGRAHEFVYGFAKQTRHTGAGHDGFIVRGCCAPATSARYCRGIFIPGGGAVRIRLLVTHPGSRPGLDSSSLPAPADRNRSAIQNDRNPPISARMFQHERKILRIGFHIDKTDISARFGVSLSSRSGEGT